MTDTNSKTASMLDQLEELRTLWKQRYLSPPSLRSLPIMRRQLAWRVQADHFATVIAGLAKLVEEVNQ